MLQNAAGQELLDHLGDDRSPESKAVREPLIVDGAERLEMTLEEAIERRGPRTARRYGPTDPALTDAVAELPALPWTSRS